MALASGRDKGWVSGAVLAGLTLGIFYVLQDYGPESAIRRFHRAISSQPVNVQELAQVTQQEVGQGVVSQLVQTVLAIDPTAQRYQLRRMDRSPRQVRAEVAYLTPPGYVVVLPWVVRKTPGSESWRVDAVETLGWMQSYLTQGVRW